MDKDRFKFYGGKTLRYAAAAIGGYFVAQGDLDVASLDTYMGAISTIGSIVVSVFLSRKRRIAEAQDE